MISADCLLRETSLTNELDSWRHLLRSSGEYNIFGASFLEQTLEAALYFRCLYVICYMLYVFFIWFRHDYHDFLHVSYMIYDI